MPFLILHFKHCLYDTSEHFGDFKNYDFHNKITPFYSYHLNKHRYPKRISISISTTATTAMGKNAPARTPRQNESDASPTAFEHPLIQKLSILILTNLLL